MRVLVAIGALAERHSLQLDQLRILRLGLMAFLAWNAGVLASEGEPCFGMIKVADRFPIVEAVALRTVLAQPAAMCIRMASSALARKAEKRPVKILYLDSSSLGLRNVRRVVALLASEAGVFPFQRISGLSVIESLLRRFPVNDLEVFAVVLGMATDALLVTGLRHQGSVITPTRRNALSNFGVALEALEVLVASCKPVAGSAVGRSGQGLMSAGQRAR